MAQQLVPAMMDPVLGDYARNVPDARDAEVLSLFAAIINKVEGAMIEEVPKIFEARLSRFTHYLSRPPLL